MNEVSYAVFLIALGIAPQNPTPLDQIQKAEAPVPLIGVPTLVPVQPVRILLPPLKKMDNK